MKKAIRKATSKRKVKIKNTKQNKWWDEECREKRREVTRALEKSLENCKDREAKKVYYGERKDYKKLLKRKKENEEERFLGEIEKHKSEKVFWKAVQRENVRWKEINLEIKPEQWKEYFRKQYDGDEEEEENGRRKGGRR